TVFVFLSLGPAQTPISNKPTEQKPAAAAPIATMNVDELRPGTRGVAYTVFQGVNPEPMEVEVLGVLRNMNGPKSDLILVRLHGDKPEYTGVVAGMSGSPVYIDKKLVGAIAYRIGSFSKEPIAGVTPITEMLEINELDRSIPGRIVSSAKSAAGNRSTAMDKTGSPSVPESLPGNAYGRLLEPIDTPMVLSGFDDSVVKVFANQFAAAGTTPVLGAGSISNDKQPDPIVPGSAISAVLVR